MAKEKTVFFCSNCGQESIRWVGRCPGCGEYNTMTEKKVATAAKPGARGARSTARKMRPVRIDEIPAQDHARRSTGFTELDREMCIRDRAVTAREPIQGMEHYLGLFYEQPASLLAWRENVAVALDEPARIRERAQDVALTFSEMRTMQLEQDVYKRQAFRWKLPRHCTPDQHLRTGGTATADSG